ncbi:TadE family type IV pilus minor pilin [Streptomyces sp. NPDC058470]|uniref:TadE family type IV pilus minor pilin n=1 Tax=Streptomyces sp. NPDC058470 TaxID=3346515 RepID=UPI00366717E2
MSRCERRAEAERIASVVRGPAPAGRVVRGPLRCRDRGFVTAEAAVVLPALVLVAMSLVWALLAASAQIQCQDAARAGARAAARQDSPDAVLTTTRRAAPRGARVEMSREGDLVRVTVTASAPGPDGLTLELSDEAVALAEETVGVSGG